MFFHFVNSLIGPATEICRHIIVASISKLNLAQCLVPTQTILPFSSFAIRFIREQKGYAIFEFFFLVGSEYFRYDSVYFYVFFHEKGTFLGLAGSLGKIIRNLGKLDCGFFELIFC